LKDKALTWVLNNYSKAEKFRRPYDDKFVSFYKLWRALSTDVPSNYRSTWQSRLGTEIIESVLPKIINANIRMEFLAQEEGDKELEKVTNSLVDWQWNKIKADKQLRLWVKDMLIYGTSHMKLVWDTIKNLPKLIPLDIDCVYVDPAATEPLDARYIIHKTYASPLDLKNNPNYSKGEVKKVIAEVQEEAEKEESATKPAEDRNNDRYAAQGITGETKPIEILECWGEYDGQERLVAIANKKYVLRNDKNPYKHGRKPFVKIVAMDVPHEYYGMGLMEIIQQDVDRHTTIVRQFQDNASRINNKMWKIRKGSGIKRADLISRPNGVIEMNDLSGDLQEIVHQPLGIDLYKEEENILTRIRNLIGLLDNDAPNVTKTATGMAILQESSNERARIMTKIIEDDGLIELGEMWLSLNKQFIKKDIVIRITGNQGVEWKTITPDQITEDFDIKVVAGSQLPQNKQARLQNFMSYYSGSVNNPIIDQFKLEQERADLFGVPVDMVNQPEKVVGAMQGGLNAETISPSPMGIPGMEGLSQGLEPTQGTPVEQAPAGVGY
jgi:hypothetical protein